MEEIRAKDDALIGVSLAINELIINDDLNDAVKNSLRYIGEAFSEDCFLVEIKEHENDGLVMFVRNYWMNQFDQKRIDYNNGLKLNKFPDILESLVNKKPYIFKEKEASEALLEHLKKTGGKAGILFPVFVNDKLWGAFSIGTIIEKKWSVLTRSIFTSYSFAIAATIKKIQYSKTLEEEVEKKSKEIFRRNKQLASLIANTPGVVFQCLLDEHWTMSYISPYVEEVTGYSANRFIDSENPMTFERLIHENDRSFVRDEINEQLSESPIYKVNYRIVDAQGNIKWMFEQGVKTKKKGEDDVLEGCIIDISDSVQSQEKVMSAILETEERERSRISREIHDNLQQLLTTAHLNLEFGKKKVRQGKTDDLTSLETASEYLTKAIEVSRNLSHRLMPKAIEDYGYSAAVEALIENLNGTINTELSYYDNLKEEELPTHIALSLYRITQEAITNVIKYANATKATIQLIYHNSSIILSIDDNGQGFDANMIRNEKGAFGLNSMKNRAESIGGRFDIESSIGRGTQIIIELPYLTKTT
ncbi:MAG: PAS domain-containing protein [Reichenbachiella sp.]